MKKRKCSWRKARERTTMDETCNTPDYMFSDTKDYHAILEPSASVVRCAPVNKLYYTDVSCKWVLSTVSCLIFLVLGPTST